MDRNHSVDRLARWMATGVTTAGLSMAIIPLAHGGLFPARKDRPATEQSLAAPGRNSAAMPSVGKSTASVNVVGLRRQGPRQPVVIAPASQPAAAPVYVPQPMYYPNGAPATQVPQQYHALQDQMSGQQDTAVSRELRRLYEESGRQAPQQPGTQQPAYAMPPGYVAVPGYAPAAVPPGYAPQPVYYPQPGYAPVPVPGYVPGATQAPPSQPISTDPAEDPEFFPGEGLAGGNLGGLEFEQPGSRPPQPAPQYQQPIQQPPVYGFAYPGPAIQQQPTPIITAGVVPPNVQPPPSLIKLPDAGELVAGTPIETDYEMSADPKHPRKGFLGRFGSATIASQKPPVEPDPYVPNPAAHLLVEDDTIPLAPGADVPGPEQDPAMAEIARFSNPDDPLTAPGESVVAGPVVEELPAPVVTPGFRTLPVAAAATIGSAARARASASELFKDVEPAAAPKVEAAAIKPAAPKKRRGIAAGGLGPGKNVVPEQPEPAVKEGPVAVVVPVPVPVPAPIDAVPTREVADGAAAIPKVETASPYSGLSLDGAAAPAPLMARENRGQFFPPVVAESVAETAAAPLPLPTEVSPSAMPTATVQPVSEAPTTAQVPGRSAYTQSKYEQIASRTGASGLKGFCPVRLRDHRDLADGQPQFRVQHNGRVYALSSAEALQTFLSDPEKYVPAASGYDVVVHQQSGETVEGVLDHSAWFKGRLYLFTSAENKEAFVASPAAYSVK